MLIKDLFEATTESLQQPAARKALVQGLTADAILCAFLATVLRARSASAISESDRVRLASIAIYLVTSGRAGPCLRGALWFASALLPLLPRLMFGFLSLFSGIFVACAHIVGAVTATFFGACAIYGIFSFSLCLLFAWIGMYSEMLRHFCSLLRHRSDPLVPRRDFLLDRLCSLSNRRDNPPAPELTTVRVSRNQEMLQAVLQADAEVVQTRWTHLLQKNDAHELFCICLYFQAGHEGAGVPSEFREGPNGEKLPPLAPTLHRLSTLVNERYLSTYESGNGHHSRVSCISKYLAGPLVHFLLPFPFLQHLSRPFSLEYFQYLLCTPFDFLSFRLRPKNPAARNSSSTYFIPIKESDEVKDFLTSVAVLVLGATSSGVYQSDLPDLVAAVLEDGWAKSQKEEVERLLPEAILDTILLWKEVKTEKEARRRKKQGKE